MDSPEEKQESLQGHDLGAGSADPASAGNAELKNETDRSPGLETLWEGEPQGDSVPEATIIPEDATPPKGPLEPEKNLEESKRLTEGSIDIEAEAVSDHLSLPEEVERGHGPDVFWWLQNHRKAVGSVFIGLCVLFLVYGLGRLLTCRHGKHQRTPSVQVYWSPVEKGASDILNFDRFLVLLPKTDEATYLLLKISVKPSNPAVYEEMDEKRTFCRASIYAALNKEVNSNRRQRISMKIPRPCFNCVFQF